MNTTATARTKAKFQNILYATDFSDAAERAIPYVKKIAEVFDANLVVLNVCPPVVNPMTPPATWTRDIEAAKAVDEQERAELLAQFAGVRTQVLIKEGDFQSAFADTMEKNNTDLVVIGTRGRGGLGKLLLGSVAEEIFRTVSCPVLTVGPHSGFSIDPNSKIREILYATDLSAESKGAADYAISLAQEFQSHLTLLHVVVQQPDDLIIQANLEPGLDDLLRAVVPADATAQLKPEFLVESGFDAAEKILDFAVLKKADMIVLGFRPEKSTSATHALKPVAHKVVSHADCPVLAIGHRS